MRFLNTEIEKLGQPADLKREFDVLVTRVQAVMALNAEHQEHLQAHVCDLEASVRQEILLHNNGIITIQIFSCQRLDYFRSSIVT